MNWVSDLDEGLQKHSRAQYYLLNMNRGYKRVVPNQTCSLGIESSPRIFNALLDACSRDRNHQKVCG